MTSNITESVNAMFDVEREFPIVSLFNEINSRFALLFHQRRIELVHSTNRSVTSIEKDISKYVNMVTSCWLIKSLTTSSVSLVMVMLLLWIYKEELVLVKFLIWTK